MSFAKYKENTELIGKDDFDCDKDVFFWTWLKNEDISSPLPPGPNPINPLKLSPSIDLLLLTLMKSMLSTQDLSAWVCCEKHIVSLAFDPVMLPIPYVCSISDISTVENDFEFFEVNLFF